MMITCDVPGTRQVAYTDPVEMRRLVGVIMLLRYLTAAVVMLVAIVVKAQLLPPLPLFLGCLLFVAANAALHLWSLNRHNLPYAYRLLPYFDIGFAPVLFATSGGFLSPLTAVFLLSAMSSSLLFTENKHLALRLFSIAAVSYLGVALLQKSGLLPWGFTSADPVIGNNRIFYSIVAGIMLLHTAAYALVRFIAMRQLRMLDNLVRSIDQLIERREEAMRRCAHTRKMEAIGRITSSVAHDFNNIIAAISGYATMLNKKLDGNEQCRSYVRHIIDASKHTASTLERLSRYGRSDGTNPVPVDVNEVIRSAIEKAQEEYGKKPAITATLMTIPSFVSGDPVQLHDVLSCLLRNALDACGSGGSITIAAEKSDIDANDPLRQCFSLSAREYIRISVSDNGCGMNDEVRSRLFEPYFTTKPRNGGTSHGLSNVWHYIIDFRGAIDVQSSPGAGSTFQLYLPPCQPVATAENTPETDSATTNSSARTILIVDDEPSVREIYSEILMDAKYTVSTAKNGADAMQFLARSPRQTVLVLLDMIMPVMDGSETFRAIREKYPAIKILFMSGIVDQEKIAPLLKERHTAFFQKPCDDEQLLALVDSMISSAATP